MNEINSPATFRHQAAEEVFDWLLNRSYGERFIDNLLVDLAGRLRGAGLSVARLSLHLHTQHREWFGATLIWKLGVEEVEVITHAYSDEPTEGYRNSPILSVRNGATEIRRHLADLAEDQFDFPVLADLKAQGLTDYVVWPIHYTLGKFHVLTFSSDAPRGFSLAELAFLRRITPLIALVTEVRSKNIVLRTLMETYVGPIAAQRILAGETRRGLGSSIEAATMISDLRHFTDMTAERPRDEVIAVLNAYFEAIADPIERHGGEILKFMGDGMLAIFPLDQPEACANLIAAVREGQERLAALNAENLTSGLPELHQGVGIHLGEVSYGNIGSRNRLDFTVIGPVVNIAARLQGLTREVDCPVLVTGDFARRADRPDDFTAIGTFPVRGIPEPIEVLALKL
ncbi:MAG TPA: adenylate/guanylate cyclase domain-containing protein [Albidovulum sp.]|uniref:adenylate/guanylate cyclase domain-containing protein n=1 Tax=Albidovulum sp. TaxID=1872424 RepID=UPI002C91D9F0|nr:adenylate/guanylate cyclase domain-containing protein [Albidovulum sp.]